MRISKPRHWAELIVIAGIIVFEVKKNWQEYRERKRVYTLPVKPENKMEYQRIYGQDDYIFEPESYDMPPGFDPDSYDDLPPGY